MEKISLEEFANIIRSDEALSARLADCADQNSASELLCLLAEEKGYELYSAAKQAVSDDDLTDVAGGRNVLTGPNSGVLYPYSWFVTILRLLVNDSEPAKKPEPSPTPETYHPEAIKT